MTLGVYTGSGGDPIRMEVQVQCVWISNRDQINDMTFIDINWSTVNLKIYGDCYFAMWIDPDLGCHQTIISDAIQMLNWCISTNRDATDGSNGCNCTNSTNTYCNRSPNSRSWLFQRPSWPKGFARDSQGNRLIDPLGNFILNDLESMGTGLVDTFVEIGMSSFMYYNGNGLGGTLHPNTVDPTQAIEFYYYLTTRWKMDHL